MESVVEGSTFFTLISLGNCLTPSFYIGYHIFLVTKYSGCPYKDETMEKAAKKILIVSVVWTVARLVKTIYYITNMLQYIYTHFLVYWHKWIYLY